MNYFSKKKLNYNPSLKRNIGNKLLTITSALFASISVLPLLLVLSYVIIKGGSYINFETLTATLFIIGIILIPSKQTTNKAEAIVIIIKMFLMKLEFIIIYVNFIWLLKVENTKKTLE